MKRLILIGLMAYVITALIRTGKFSMDDIKIRHFHNPEWEMPFLTSDQKTQIGKILAQPFYFSKQTKDAYSYISKDKKYRIKLIKQKPLSELTWAHFLPLPSKMNPFLTRSTKKKKSLRERLVNQSKQKLKSRESLYHHFNKTKYINKKTPFVDNRGKKHFIDMDEVEFIIRKNG